jgi:hypothetical protein
MQNLNVVFGMRLSTFMSYLPKSNAAAAGMGTMGAI